MPTTQQDRWTNLFQRFVYGQRQQLPKKYEAPLHQALEQLTTAAFSREVRKWTGEPPLRLLTSTGSHVLKNLI